MVFINSELYKKHVLDKLKITDILIKVENNIINLEMNTTGRIGDLQKSAEYAYYLVGNQRKVSDSYDIRKNIQIRFDARNMFLN